METQLDDNVRGTPAGREAEAILRQCVHCGFCNATCPTYQLLGDELDGPRGRIYLIKQLLEGGAVSATTQRHLDRCLSCRACETTCPSGVQYGRLLDIGRGFLKARVRRRAFNALRRAALRGLLSRRRPFAVLLGFARALRGVLPRALRERVPLRRDPGLSPPGRRARRMIVLAGCVQPALQPAINAASARVFDRLGITLVEASGREGAGCCGALRQHLDDVTGARADARRNIDAWWPLLETGCAAIVTTASACGLQVREYDRLLADDARYAAKAARVARAARDVAEILAAERGTLVARLAEAAGASPPGPARVAFQSPCTLQHGQKVRGLVEELLTAAGYALTPVADTHLCCGAAGTYALLQPQIAARLRDDKLAALAAGAPDVVASANIGCIVHLQGGTAVPVRHWIELLDARLPLRADA